MIKKIILVLFIIFAFAITGFNISRAATSQTADVSEPHWQSGTINVYIPKDAQAAAMRRAFQQWENLCPGKLNFVFKEKGPAQIDVIFTESVDGSDTPLGAYNVKINKGYITKAEISIAVKNPKISKYSSEYIYKTMLHEIGHALGLSDESRPNSGIMYMPLTAQQQMLKLDKRRIYRLYKWSYND